MAAEGVSLALIQSVLKGLQRSPRIVTDPAAMNHRGVLTAADISCLVVPDGSLGLPVLAALEQGIRVIAVRENRNLMDNNLRELPWSDGQLFVVENYWEAGGSAGCHQGRHRTGVGTPAHRPGAGKRESLIEGPLTTRGCPQIEMGNL